METPKYEDYEGLIRKYAASFSRTTGLPLEELMAEGRLYFAKALKKWNPERGKFSTVLVWYLRTELINWAQVEGRRTFEVLSDPTTMESVGIDYTVRTVLLNDALKRLSDDAQSVARIIFTTPREISNALRTSGDGSALKQVSGWLRRQGWNDTRIVDAYMELSALANTL